MQLNFDSGVEAFRAEFIAFLDEHLPDADGLERPHSSSHTPDWARRWQRTQFDHGWLVPGNPPEYGGRNAGILEQYVHRETLAERGIHEHFNPQGVGIIAASLLTFGTEDQKRRWAIPILRGDLTASLGMSEPGAGSDLAGLSTRARLEDDHFIVDGQKVWTSGAHDADVVLTFVRTDPDALKHRGISALLIPTDLPGVHRRPFASVARPDDLDFNEIFFDSVRVPAGNLLGDLNAGWRVASGSLGHERNLLWTNFASRLDGLLADFHPVTALEENRYATLTMDAHALRLLGSQALAKAARGEEAGPGLSVLKLLGSEAVQAGAEHALAAAGPGGLDHPGVTARYSPLSLEDTAPGWFERFVRTFAGTIAGGTSEIQRTIIAERVLGLPRP